MFGAWQKGVVCLALAALASGAGARRARAQAAAGDHGVDAPGATLEPPRAVNAPPEPRFFLHPTRDGGYTYDGPTFGARISPDGRVTFHDRHFQLSPDGPDPSTVGIDAVTPQVPISGDIPVAIESRPGVRFDVTDEYMRLMGQDPARDEKMTFLAATFDIRMNMAMQVRSAQQRAALAELPDRLAGLWRDPRLTPIERLHLLRAMWDDLAPGPDADPARAVIRTFAQQHLPAQDAAAFSPNPAGPR
jgi:hypothetical protein